MKIKKLPIEFRSSSVLAFFLGLTVVLLGYFINSLGIRPLNLLRSYTPHEQKKNVSETAKEKILKSRKNTFYLKKDASIVPKALAAPYISAVSYIVVDQKSGEVLLAQNESNSYPIASLTKIMSAVVTLDLVSPDTIFTVTKNAAAKSPTKIGIVPGQKMTVSELLHAALLTSANDATQLLMDGVDAIYGRGTFIAAMNEKAAFLNLTRSRFQNPQGFDSPENYSSAHDLAVLSTYALSSYPLISEIAKKEYAFLPKSTFHKQFDLYNWNGLLGTYPGTSGLKIGNTPQAGYTMVASSTREGKKLLVVVLGTPDIVNRDMDSATLLDAGFENEGLSPIGITREELLSKYATWEYWN